MTKWIDDIVALLNDSQEQLTLVESLCDQALDDQTARSRLTTRVKNVLENQRSALDYLAVGLTREFGTRKGAIYYPLAQDDNEFPELMEKWMPGVAGAQPAIAGAIRRHQPYQQGQEWLRELNQLTRQQKHNELTPQIVQESWEGRVTEKATGAFVQWRGMRFEPGALISQGGSMEIRPEPGRSPDAPQLIVFGGPTGVLVFGVPLDPATQQPLPNDSLVASAGSFHQWCFIQPHVPILFELQIFQQSVRTLINNVVHASSL
jgi:hypothetical protein